MAAAAAVRGGGMVALVTGASSGIGEATARLLARERRAAVVLVARREQRLRALADQLGNDSSWVAADLTAEDAPRRVSERSMMSSCTSAAAWKSSSAAAADTTGRRSSAPSGSNGSKACARTPCQPQ